MSQYKPHTHCDCDECEKVWALHVVELERLHAEIARVKMDRDHAWKAFTRLRKAYAMLRYPTLNEEIKLLYDAADAIAAGKETLENAGQYSRVTRSDRAK